MPIYLKYDGIDGDATEESHKDWIPLDSANYSTSRNIATPTGQAARRESGAPTLSEVVITKPSDKASQKLFAASLSGESKTVKIDFVRTGDPGEIYMTLTLSNVLISSYSFAAHSGGMGGTETFPVESLSLNFTKIEESYTPYSADHKPGTPQRYTYDVATAKKS
ncbi:MAG: Hcp family type VI secretion system effector [Alphaproteobacteria bacterium]